MDNQQAQLEAIKDIRALMERSSKFLFLSGIAGVIVGIIAIIGVIIAYSFLGIQIDEPGYFKLVINEYGVLNKENFGFLFSELILLLMLAIGIAVTLAKKQAASKKIAIWNTSARQMLLNMALPLIAGAAYCAILFYQGQVAFIAPATILFYGLALLNASKYTIDGIRSLAVFEIIIGLIASIYVDFGLLFWAIGFGILHIVYGLYIYFKYEK